MSDQPWVTAARHESLPVSELLSWASSKGRDEAEWKQATQLTNASPLSDCESPSHWMVDDTEENLCPGTQLCAADHCPHYQPRRPALPGVCVCTIGNRYMCFTTEVFCLED